MNIRNFLSYDYQFGIQPGAGLTLHDKFYAIIGAGLVLIAIVLKIGSAMASNPVDKKYRNKFYKPLMFTGIWEVVWLGLRFQAINFFGTHFVAWLGILVGAIWFLLAVVSTIRFYSKEKSFWEKEQVRLKYLPR